MCIYTLHILTHYRRVTTAQNTVQYNNLIFVTGLVYFAVPDSCGNTDYSKRTHERTH